VSARPSQIRALAQKMAPTPQQAPKNADQKNVLGGMDVIASQTSGTPNDAQSGAMTNMEIKENGSQNASHARGLKCFCPRPKVACETPAAITSMIENRNSSILKLFVILSYHYCPVNKDIKVRKG